MGVPWSEVYWVASFRGVEFRIRSTGAEGGRRLRRFDIPITDLPLFEDSGRRPREFTLDGYLVGEDYLTQKEALLAALEEPGPGELLHPLWGLFDATSTGWRVSEDIKEGRSCRLTMGFVEAERFATEVRKPQAALEGDVDEAGTAAEDVAAAELEADLVTTGVPEEVREATSSAIVELGQTLQGLDVFLGPSREVADFSRSVRDLVANAVSLANAPADLAFQALSALRDVGSILEQAPKSVRAAYAKLRAFQPSSSTTASPQALSNQAALQKLVHYAAVAGDARGLAASDWDFYAQATAARDAALESIDELLHAASDDGFDALRAIQARVSESVPPQGEDLPDLETIEIKAPVPTLVLAWDLYQDGSRAEEIAARNDVANPLFASGSLEVLVEDG